MEAEQEESEPDLNFLASLIFIISQMKKMQGPAVVPVVVSFLTKLCTVQAVKRNTSVNK